MIPRFRIFSETAGESPSPVPTLTKAIKLQKPPNMLILYYNFIEVLYISITVIYLIIFKYPTQPGLQICVYKTPRTIFNETDWSYYYYSCIILSVALYFSPLEPFNT